MGYTHYWRQDEEISEGAWARILGDCSGIVLHCMPEIELGNHFGVGGPWIGYEKIALNGVGPDSHESFVLTRKMSDFEFCKTAGKPYDLAVCACLLILAAHTNVIVSSDGERADWHEAIELVSSVLGYGRNVGIRW